MEKPKITLASASPSPSGPTCWSATAFGAKAWSGRVPSPRWSHRRRLVASVGRTRGRRLLLWAVDPGEATQARPHPRSWRRPQTAPAAGRPGWPAYVFPVSRWRFLGVPSRTEQSPARLRGALRGLPDPPDPQPGPCPIPIDRPGDRSPSGLGKSVAKPAAPLAVPGLTPRARCSIRSYSSERARLAPPSSGSCPVPGCPWRGGLRPADPACAVRGRTRRARPALRRSRCTC
jgi:hypothetical protein